MYSHLLIIFSILISFTAKAKGLHFDPPSVKLTESGIRIKSLDEKPCSMWPSLKRFHGKWEIKNECVEQNGEFIPKITAGRKALPGATMSCIGFIQYKRMNFNFEDLCDGRSFNKVIYNERIYNLNHYF
jgi:hypothetical protein